MRKRDDMRWLTHILLCGTCFALLSMPSFAQRGFGGRAAGPSSTAIGIGAIPASPSLGNRGGFASGRGYYNNGFVGSSRSGYAGRRRGDYRRIPYGYFFSPYYYPFLDYGSAPYGGAPYDVPEGDPNADAAFMAQNALGEQVQRLTAELDQLRYGSQMLPQSATAGHPSDAAPPALPITVILRNGQKLQVENYAVMGQTLWDFSKQPVRKIPLSSIDVAASTQATAASGAEFPQIAPAP